MINVNDFKPGITFVYNNEPYEILDAKHSKQGRGQANVKAKVKNLKTGAQIILSFTGGEKVEAAHIDKKTMQYLYRDDNNIYFWDAKTFEQISLPANKLKTELNYLVEGSEITVMFYQNKPLNITLPAKVDIEVQQADEAIKGNTSTNPSKQATLVTGYKLQVPMFVKTGDKITISTATGLYTGRSKQKNEDN